LARGYSYHFIRGKEEVLLSIPCWIDNEYIEVQLRHPKPPSNKYDKSGYRLWVHLVDPEGLGSTQKILIDGNQSYTISGAGWIDMKITTSTISTTVRIQATKGDACLQSIILLGPYIFVH